VTGVIWREEIAFSMSAGRFFVDPAVLAAPGEVILPSEIAHQVRAVLRLRPGDQIILLDGSGAAFVVALTAVEREGVRGQIVDRQMVATEPRARLTLVVGLLKAAKFDWVIQKGTEIGVSAFAPAITARSVSGLEEAGPAKQRRWHTIAVEAAEQANRGCVPAILPPRPLSEILAGDGPILVAYESTGPHALSIDAVIRSIGYTQEKAELRLAIGPEGGLTREEIALARERGAQIVTLGPRILRAETAAIVAVALALAALGDLG
jgi:16S rRNA (uracil1498-N3)-methyltransferase